MPSLPDELAEGEGVEPSTRRSARFSRPVACRHAPPSCKLDAPTGIEPAQYPRSKRGALPLSYGAVRPGGVEPPTALLSGAHDGYKPSALPVELWAQSLRRNWRSVGRSNPSHPIDSRVASPDA